MLFIITIVVFAAVALAVWAVFQPPKESILGRRVGPTSYREAAKEIALEGSLSQRVFWNNGYHGWSIELYGNRFLDRRRRECRACGPR